MTWNLVAHQKIDGTNIPTTGASMDTTGATLLIVISSTNGGSVVLLDSKGNTWHALTLRNAAPNYAMQIQYAWNPIVGTGHTITLDTGSIGNGSVVVLAVSGARTTSDPFLVENATATAAGDTGVTVASITPSVNGALIITAMGLDDPGGNTMGCSGFTITDTFDVVPGSTFGVSGAYAVQAVAAAISPVWTRSTTNTGVGDWGLVAAFAPAPDSAAWADSRAREPRGLRGPLNIQKYVLQRPKLDYTPAPASAQQQILASGRAGVTGDAVMTIIAGLTASGRAGGRGNGVFGVITQVLASGRAGSRAAGVFGVITPVSASGRAGARAAGTFGLLRPISASGWSGSRGAAVAGAIRLIAASGRAGSNASATESTTVGMLASGLSGATGSGLFFTPSFSGYAPPPSPWLTLATRQLRVRFDYTPTTVLAGNPVAVSASGTSGARGAAVATVIAGLTAAGRAAARGSAVAYATVGLVTSGRAGARGSATGGFIRGMLVSGWAGSRGNALLTVSSALAAIAASGRSGARGGALLGVKVAASASGRAGSRGSGLLSAKLAFAASGRAGARASVFTAHLDVGLFIADEIVYLLQSVIVHSAAPAVVSVTLAQAVVTKLADVNPTSVSLK